MKKLKMTTNSTITFYQGCNLYLDNLKNEIENSIVFTDNGYVFWVVAKDVSNAEEVIKGML